MNRFFVALALACLPASVSAECVKFDYAELKDMRPQELQAAYSENQREGLQAFQQGTVFLENGDRAGYRQQDRIYQDCEAQAGQIMRVLERTPAAESPH